jgi:hypothetical protein
MPSREEERLVLLIAVVHAALAEGGATEPAAVSEAAWARMGHPHRDSWAWNPRRSRGWATDARLDHQNHGWSGRY